MQMSAAKLEIQWGDEREVFSLPCRPEGLSDQAPASTVLRTIAKTPTVRCPHCDSIIYSRRGKLCGVCDGVLPESCLFTEREARRVEGILRGEQRRHRLW